MKKYIIKMLAVLGSGVLALLGIGLVFVNFPDLDNTTRGWLIIVGLVAISIAGKYLR